MKTSQFTLPALALLAIGLAGCGSDEASASRPPQSQPIPTDTTPPPAKKNWTKEEKIAAIQNAPIPKEQKEKEIARINAGG